MVGRSGRLVGFSGCGRRDIIAGQGTKGGEGERAGEGARGGGEGEGGARAGESKDFGILGIGGLAPCGTGFSYGRWHGSASIL